MSDTAGEDRKTQGHDVHGHGHVGRGKDGKAVGDPHDGAAVMQALEEIAGNTQPGEGAEGSNSATPQANSQY